MSPDKRLEHGANAENVISDIQRYFRQIIVKSEERLETLRQEGSIQVIKALGIDTGMLALTTQPIEEDARETQAPKRVQSEITIQDIAVQLKVLDRDGQQVVWEFLRETDKDRINLPKFLADLLDAINKKPANHEQGKKVAKFLKEISLAIAISENNEGAQAYYAAMLDEKLTSEELSDIEDVLEDDNELNDEILEIYEDAEDILIENLLKLIQEKFPEQEISH